MPNVTVYAGTEHKRVYQVGGKSFIFVRNPRPDAFDPETGERYDDVIVFWVPNEGDKLAMVQDDSSPFFTTPHFDGHLSVLLRASRIGEVTRRAHRGRAGGMAITRVSHQTSSVAQGTHAGLRPGPGCEDQSPDRARRLHRGCPRHVAHENGLRPSPAGGRSGPDRALAS